MTDTGGILMLRIILITLFVFVFLQDIKERSISVWVIAFLFIAVGMFGFATKDDLTSFVFSSLWNLLFVVLQISLLTIYVVFRFRVRISHIFRYVGPGDLLFWVAICPLITFPLFVMHFIASLVLALGLHLVFARFSFYQSKTIPLAGMQGMYYSVSLIIPAFE